jgi:hypothetical protein
MQWILEDGVWLTGSPESGCGVLPGTAKTDCSKWYVNVFVKEDGKGVACFGPFDTKEDAMNKGEEEHKTRSTTESYDYLLI